MASDTSKQALQIAAEQARAALIRYKKAHETEPTGKTIVTKKGATLYSVRRTK